jgi:hypothetical protein
MQVIKKIINNRDVLYIGLILLSIILMYVYRPVKQQIVVDKTSITNYNNKIDSLNRVNQFLLNERYVLFNKIDSLKLLNQKIDIQKYEKIRKEVITSPNVDDTELYLFFSKFNANFISKE